MTIKELLLNDGNFASRNEADFDRVISSIYCCDLLSIVMGRAPANSGWITVMGNTNGIAVAVLTDVSVIIAAEGIEPDEPSIIKAKEQGVNVLFTKLPIFEAALRLHELINV